MSVSGQGDHDADAVAAVAYTPYERRPSPHSQSAPRHADHVARAAVSEAPPRDRDERNKAGQTRDRPTSSRPRAGPDRRDEIQQLSALVSQKVQAALKDRLQTSPVCVDLSSRQDTQPAAVSPQPQPKLSALVSQKVQAALEERLQTSPTCVDLSSRQDTRPAAVSPQLQPKPQLSGLVSQKVQAALEERLQPSPSCAELSAQQDTQSGGRSSPARPQAAHTDHGAQLTALVRQKVAEAWSEKAKALYGDCDIPYGDLNGPAPEEGEKIPLTKQPADWASSRPWEQSLRSPSYDRRRRNSFHTTRDIHKHVVYLVGSEQHLSPGGTGTSRSAEVKDGSEEGERSPRRGRSPARRTTPRSQQTASAAGEGATAGVPTSRSQSGARRASSPHVRRPCSPTPTTSRTTASAVRPVSADGRRRQSCPFLPAAHTPGPQSCPFLPAAHTPGPQSCPFLPAAHTPGPQSCPFLPAAHTPGPQSCPFLPAAHTPGPQSCSFLPAAHTPGPQSCSFLPAAHTPGPQSAPRPTVTPQIRRPSGALHTSSGTQDKAAVARDKPQSQTGSQADHIACSKTDERRESEPPPKQLRTSPTGVDVVSTGESDALVESSEKEAGVSQADRQRNTVTPGAGRQFQLYQRDTAGGDQDRPGGEEKGDKTRKFWEEKLNWDLLYKVKARLQARRESARATPANKGEVRTRSVSLCGPPTARTHHPATVEVPTDTHVTHTTHITHTTHATQTTHTGKLSGDGVAGNKEGREKPPEVSSTQSLSEPGKPRSSEDRPGDVKERIRSWSLIERVPDRPQHDLLDKAQSPAERSSADTSPVTHQAPGAEPQTKGLKRSVSRGLVSTLASRFSTPDCVGPRLKVFAVLPSKTKLAVSPRAVQTYSDQLSQLQQSAVSQSVKKAGHTQTDSSPVSRESQQSAVSVEKAGHTQTDSSPVSRESQQSAVSVEKAGHTQTDSSPVSRESQQSAISQSEERAGHTQTDSSPVLGDRRDCRYSPSGPAGSREEANLSSTQGRVSRDEGDVTTEDRHWQAAPPNGHTTFTVSSDQRAGRQLTTAEGITTPTSGKTSPGRDVTQPQCDVSQTAPQRSVGAVTGRRGRPTAAVMSSPDRGGPPAGGGLSLELAFSALLNDIDTLSATDSTASDMELSSDSDDNFGDKASSPTFVHVRVGRSATKTGFGGFPEPSVASSNNNNNSSSSNNYFSDVCTDSRHGQVGGVKRSNSVTKGSNQTAVPLTTMEEESGGMTTPVGVDVIHAPVTSVDVSDDGGGQSGADAERVEVSTESEDGAADATELVSQ